MNTIKPVHLKQSLLNLISLTIFSVLSLLITNGKLIASSPETGLKISGAMFAATLTFYCTAILSKSRYSTASILIAAFVFGFNPLLISLANYNLISAMLYISFPVIFIISRQLLANSRINYWLSSLVIFTLTLIVCLYPPTIPEFMSFFNLDTYFFLPNDLSLEPNLTYSISTFTAYSETGFMIGFYHLPLLIMCLTIIRKALYPSLALIFFAGACIILACSKSFLSISPILWAVPCVYLLCNMLQKFLTNIEYIIYYKKYGYAIFATIVITLLTDILSSASLTISNFFSRIIY